jgi:pimeloyl-ACP methyl ester carboxylesterase
MAIVTKMNVVEFELEDATLHALVDGPNDGPLAILLHGFPDTAHTFGPLAPHLVEKGYRVVRPFLRGYSPSSLSKTNDYGLASLAQDAIAIHERLDGDERALLLGHDWGASVVYAATNAEPERWQRAVTMSVPPLAVIGAALSTFKQLRLSWYMFYFQNPTAEVVIESNDMEFLQQLWSSWSPQFDSEEELVFVRQSLGTRENLSAALAYYRAMFNPTPPTDPVLQALSANIFTTPTVPTLYLHGDHDGCIGLSDSALVLQHLAPGSRVEVVRNAGHFIHLEQPEQVAGLIDSFL